MSLKLVGKQQRLSSMTPSRTPVSRSVSGLRVTSSASQSHRNSLLNVSVSEHKRVLAKNDVITKENALLKQQLRQLKSDLLASKATQPTHRQTNSINSNNEKLTFESFITALSLMNKINEYVCNGLEDLEAELDQMRAIIANCESLLRQNYPQYYVEFHQQNQNQNQNRNAHTVASGESSRHSSGVASKRFSMSASHRELRRKSLLDTIKQAFHAFTELSTIIEMSKELRPSSGNFSQSSVRSTRATNPTNNSIGGKKSALNDASNTSRNNHIVCCAQTSNSSMNWNECNKENINPNASMASTSMALSPPLHCSSPHGITAEKVCAELESMRFDENDEQCTVMPVNSIGIDLDNSETQPIIRRSKRTAKKLIEYNEQNDENEQNVVSNGARSGVKIAKTTKTKRKPNPKQTRKRNNGKKTVKFVMCDTVSDEQPSVYDFSDEMNELPNSFAEYRRTLANKSN